MTAIDEDFSLQRISHWLRNYLDWRAEITSSPGMKSTTDYSQPSVMGGPGGGGFVALREDELIEKIATVNRWLNGLSEVEHLAAGYWLQADEGTIASVATASGLEYRKAKTLVLAIPIIIWSRHYARLPLDQNAEVR